MAWPQYLLYLTLLRKIKMPLLIHNKTWYILKNKLTNMLPLLSTISYFWKKWWGGVRWRDHWRTLVSASLAHPLVIFFIKLYYYEKINHMCWGNSLENLTINYKYFIVGSDFFFIIIIIFFIQYIVQVCCHTCLLLVPC